MQTLGLSDSTVRTESRLKSLFWPSIQSGADVDYLAVQGFWVCTIVGVLGLVLLTLTRQPITGIAVLLSHLRATWIADHWKPDSDEAALPPRLGETWSDRFADKWPAFIWPKIK